MTRTTTQTTLPFVYINQEFYTNTFGAQLDSDKIAAFTRAVYQSGMRINNLTGSQIETTTFDKLPISVQIGVKNATCILVSHVLANGFDNILGSTSQSTGATSISQSNPSNPDYIPQAVYDELARVGLYQTRQFGNLDLKDCNKDNSIDDYQSGCTPFSTWDAYSIKKFQPGTDKRLLISSDGSIDILLPTGANDPVDIKAKGGGAQNKLKVTDTAISVALTNKDNTGNSGIELFDSGYITISSNPNATIQMDNNGIGITVTTPDKNINLVGGTVNVDDHNIINLKDPTNPQDAATKAYVDTHSGTTNWTSPDASIRIDNTGKTLMIATDIEQQLETIGIVANLTTQKKDNLVDAVNEVNGKALQNAVDVGTLQGDVKTNTTDIAGLVTKTDTTNLKVGTATLTTLAKDLSGAVNELNAKPAGDIYPQLKTDLVAGSNITLQANDTLKTITISAVGGVAPDIYPQLKTDILAGTNVTITPDDSAKTLTIASTASGKTYTGSTGITVDNTADTIAIDATTEGIIQQAQTDHPILTDLRTHVGDVSDLTTTSKEVVGAINEVNAKTPVIYSQLKTDLVAGTNITLTPNDTNSTITINATGGGASIGDAKFTNLPGNPTSVRLSNTNDDGTTGFTLYGDGGKVISVPTGKTLFVSANSDVETNAITKGFALNATSGMTLTGIGITGLPTPTNNADAASKAYVDGKVVPVDVYTQTKAIVQGNPIVSVTADDTAKTLTLGAPQVVTNANNIGTMTDLTTVKKDTLVNAINEINAKSSGGKDWVQVGVSGTEWTWNTVDSAWEGPLFGAVSSTVVGAYKILFINNSGEGFEFDVTFAGTKINGLGPMFYNEHDGSYTLCSINCGNEMVTKGSIKLTDLTATQVPKDISDWTFTVYQFK